MIVLVFLSSVFDDVLLVCLPFCWCPCMAIHVVSVQYDGGLLPDNILLLTQCYYHRGTNPFKCHEEVLYFQLLIPPKRFDIFSPRLGDAQKVF